MKTEFFLVSSGKKIIFFSFSFFIFQVSGQILVSGLRIFSGIRSQDIFWSQGYIFLAFLGVKCSSPVKKQGWGPQ
jgi:hypothetical protein